MEYDSQKIFEIVDNEIEKQRKNFEVKKELIENHTGNQILNLEKKEKRYLTRKGTVFDKVIKTSN